jgi:hypothetical protein
LVRHRALEAEEETRRKKEGKEMRRSKLLIPLLLIALAGCASKGPATRVQMTPDQQLAFGKLAMVGASTALRLRKSDLERGIEALPQQQQRKVLTRVHYLNITIAFVDEFNHQVAGVTTLNTDSRVLLRGAIDKLIAAAGELEKDDVLALGDTDTRAYIRAAIEIARSAVQAFPVQSQ